MTFDPWTGLPFEENEDSAIDHEKNKLIRAAVELQQRRLADLAEEFFRETNPAVNDAWEKYQIVLKLARKS